MGDVLGIGLLVLAWLILKYRPGWVRRAIVAVGARAIGRAALAGQPDNLTLEPVADPNPAPQARGALETLGQRGFRPAGSFTIAEMAGMPIHFMVHDRDSIIAAIYEHPQTGVWTDLVCRYPDGRRFTICNARIGGDLAHQPGHVLVRKPGLSTAALHMAFQRERPAGSLVPVHAADVARIFADAYAEEMVWRKGRGVSADEVRSVVREMDETAFEQPEARVG